MNKKGRVILIGAEDEENLSIRYLAAALKENNHDVKIIPCSRNEDFPRVLKEFKDFNPHILGVSIAFQSLALMFFEIIRKIKDIKPEVHVTVGGHFPTFQYEKILVYEHINSVIRFEGEKPISMLVDALMNGDKLSDVPNLVYKVNSTGELIENQCIHEFPDLDTLSFPLRDKTPQMRLGENFATLVTSRGCFHSKCIYCCIGAFHLKKENKHAMRSPENVAQEIAELHNTNKVRLFQFHDDNFLLPSKKLSLERIESLKSALDKNINIDEIALLIKTRPESIDEEVAFVLKDIGTVGAFMGVENASESGLKSLARGSTIEDITNSMEILKKHEIAVTFNLLFFHPKASLCEINENIYFMKEHADHAFGFGRAEIVAGSPLDRLVRKKGLLRGEWPSYDYKIEDSSVEKMFRINALTFYKKNSPYPNISQEMIALYYRAEMIKRFYPGKKSQELSGNVNKLVIKFNEFVLENLLETYRLTGEMESDQELNNLYMNIEEICAHFTGEINDLSRKMGKFQMLQRKFKDIGISPKMVKRFF
ncbi:MAG: B12-binding domain-containing radical SAM protein [Methanobacterium sp.]|uniref:B12-binding domain-containing radical SAM protein n=1 Tax=Methanobacterium sp. TaxID=2164 RepID=UPI003D65830A|nr:B12-binding domain-containing radical SAM protein [Methanobacterium sp.]